MSGGNNRLAALAADIRAADQDFKRAALTLAERALAAGTALIEAKRLGVSADPDPEGTDPDMANHSDPQDLFPDQDLGCASKKRRPRIERTRWLTRSRAERLAEALTNLFNTDDWQQLPDAWRDLGPKEVIEALRKGPMLRIQR